MPISRHQRESKEGIGLLALGSSGPWEVAIDESLSGPTRRFAQIEGPSVYLYFEIPTVDLIDDAINFLADHSRDAQTRPLVKNGTLNVVKNADVQVCLTKDDEFNDRFFLVIEAKSGPLVRFTITDDDLRHLVKALRDAKDDLENADQLN